MQFTTIFYQALFFYALTFYYLVLKAVEYMCIQIQLEKRMAKRMERRRKRMNRRSRRRRTNISYIISSSWQYMENSSPIQQALNECLMNELNLNKHSLYNYCYFPPLRWKNQWNLKEIFWTYKIHHDKLTLVDNKVVIFICTPFWRHEVMIDLGIWDAIQEILIFIMWLVPHDIQTNNPILVGLQ